MAVDRNFSVIGVQTSHAHARANSQATKAGDTFHSITGSLIPLQGTQQARIQYADATPPKGPEEKSKTDAKPTDPAQAKLNATKQFLIVGIDLVNKGQMTVEDFHKGIAESTTKEGRFDPDHFRQFLQGHMKETQGHGTPAHHKAAGRHKGKKGGGQQKSQGSQGGGQHSRHKGGAGRNQGAYRGHIHPNTMAQLKALLEGDETDPDALAQAVDKLLGGQKIEDGHAEPASSSEPVVTPGNDKKDV